MTKRYSVKTDHQGRSYICDQKTINDLPLKTGALRDSQVAHRLNRLECIDKTLNELGKKLDRRNKHIEKLKASLDKLVKELEGINQCFKCKYGYRNSNITCPGEADAELPCAGFVERYKGLLTINQALKEAGEL